MHLQHPNSDLFILLRCHRATHIGKFFQLRLSNHHDPVIRTLAKNQLDAWRGIVKVEQSNYYTKALAMKILRQQEREELELQIVQRQEIKPTLDPTQVKFLPARYRSWLSHTQIEVTCIICVLTFKPPGTDQAARRIQRFVSKMLAKQPARMHHEIGVRQHQNPKGGTKQKVTRLLTSVGARRIY